MKSLRRNHGKIVNPENGRRGRYQWRWQWDINQSLRIDQVSPWFRPVSRLPPGKKKARRKEIWRWGCPRIYGGWNKFLWKTDISCLSRFDDGGGWKFPDEKLAEESNALFSFNFFYSNFFVFFCYCSSSCSPFLFSGYTSMGKEKSFQNVTGSIFSDKEGGAFRNCNTCIYTPIPKLESLPETWEIGVWDEP